MTKTIKPSQDKTVEKKHIHKYRLLEFNVIEHGDRPDERVGRFYCEVCLKIKEILDKKYNSKGNYIRG